MNFWTKFLMGQMLLLDKAGEGGSPGGSGSGGGAGGSGGAGDGKGGSGGAGGSGSGAPDLAAIQARLEKLEKENAELKAKGQGGGAGGSGSGDGGGGDDLAGKAAREREAAEKKNRETATLGSAIKFNMQARDWAKTNASLLPTTITGILDQADKVNYGDDIKKAAALKVGIFSEFFAQQANLELLTDTQKQALEDFKKLTQDEKHERIGRIFDDVFEPTFLALRRIKKADQVAKGHGTPTDAEAAHREKMKAFARKHHLKEKQ